MIKWSVVDFYMLNMLNMLMFMCVVSTRVGLACLVQVSALYRFAVENNPKIPRDTRD